MSRALHHDPWGQRGDVDLYVDESKAKGFCMVGVLVAHRDADGVSRAMKDARSRGASWIHFTKEKDAERARILHVITALPVRAVVVETQAVKGKEARDRALAAMTRWAAEHGVARMVLDLDESTLRSDRRVIREVLTSLGSELRYDHRRSRETPLLWLPDATAWCRMKGGPWRRSIGEMTQWFIRA